jgi:hypothetical protein
MDGIPLVLAHHAEKRKRAIRDDSVFANVLAHRFVASFRHVVRTLQA